MNPLPPPEQPPTLEDLQRQNADLQSQLEAIKNANILVKVFGANWRTTLLGYAASVALILDPVISNGNFDIKRDWKQCVAAILTAVFGNLTKDKHVTGGSETNTIK